MRNKLYILATACLAVVTQAASQTMKVIEFRQLEYDLTAITSGTEKIDQNGERAALIKIQTPERGFTFDGGSLGIVANEEHAGEIWLYVPGRAQKLIVQHPAFGVMRDFWYPIPIVAGNTYEMLIDIGAGRYTNITAQVAGSAIYIDGQYAGAAPIYHRYLNFGKHKIEAKKDRMIHGEQRDMSDQFGDVEISVDSQADIYYEDRRVGTGTWKTQLREGNHTVETRKADCDPVKTSFRVVARHQNQVKANAPVPHTGRLSVFTRPGNVKTTYNGSHFIDLSETVSVPIGTYQMEFSRRGYVTQNREYVVRHNQTTVDTVTLKRINYIKPTSFYFGLAFTASTLSGVSGIVGATYKNHDLQFGYTFGLVASGASNWMDGQGYYTATNKHKINSLSIKYGYQIPLLSKISLTPQLGYVLNTLNSSVTFGSDKYADGAKADLISIGAKMMYVPFHHCYLFAAPELDIVAKKDNTYNSAASKAGFSQGGFVLHAGVLVNF